MKCKANFLLQIVIIIGLGIPLSMALADDDHNKARHLLQSGEVLPLEIILEKLRPRYLGKVLEVELEQKSGKIIYEVEILAEDGVVHELYIDAKTGDVLRSKVED